MRFKAEEIIFGNANVIQLLPAKRPHLVGITLFKWCEIRVDRESQASLLVY